MVRDANKCIHIGDMAAYEKAEEYFANQTCEFEMVWRKKVKGRSNAQNAYYWGVVIQMIADHCGYGSRDEIEILHDYLRAKYLKRTIVLDHCEEVKVLSTTDLSTTEFMEYCQKIQMWASLKLGLSIPDPNEAPIPESYITV
jgi:hypothetical protein